MTHPEQLPALFELRRTLRNTVPPDSLYLAPFVPKIEVQKHLAELPAKRWGARKPKEEKDAVQ